MKYLRVLLPILLIMVLLLNTAVVFGADAYTDVPAEAWYNECVDYCRQNGIMLGTGTQSFSPDSNMTRGMFVTVLYRLDGENAVSEKTSFTDVAQDSYYYDAVAWAYKNEIVRGFDEKTFAPDRMVSREQAACMIARYAEYIDAAFLNDEPVELAYSDMNEVSAYARESVDIMRHTGLMLGNEKTEFQPQASISRAEAAMILMRFDMKIAGLKPAVLHVMGENGVVQTEVTLSDEATALLRTVIHNQDWVSTEIPEFIATHEIILDNVVYKFERESAGNGYSGFRFQNVYGSGYGACFTSNAALFEKLDSILFSIE